MICLLSAIISKFLSFTFLSFTFQYVSEPIKGEGIHQTQIFSQMLGNPFFSENNSLEFIVECLKTT